MTQFSGSSWCSRYCILEEKNTNIHLESFCVRHFWSALEETHVSYSIPRKCVEQVLLSDENLDSIILSCVI